jgi:hypothetical protein
MFQADDPHTTTEPGTSAGSVAATQARGGLARPSPQKTLSDACQLGRRRFGSQRGEAAHVVEFGISDAMILFCAEPC